METTEEQMAAASKGVHRRSRPPPSRSFRPNLDLITIASKNPGRHGAPAPRLVFAAGSRRRLQPNHPRDDPAAIAADIYEGLAYATGDALIGINPCIDEPAISDACSISPPKLSIDRTGCRRRTACSAMSLRRCALWKRARDSTFFFKVWLAPKRPCAGFGINVAMLDEASRAIRERGALDAPNLNCTSKRGRAPSFPPARTKAPTR